jgi:hypothetical protein
LLLPIGSLPRRRSTQTTPPLNITRRAGCLTSKSPACARQRDA